MKLLTNNFYSFVPLCFVSDGNVGRNKWDQEVKSFRYVFLVLMLFWASTKGSKMIFRFKLKCDLHAALKHFFPSDSKIWFFYQITTFPDPQINYAVPMNMISYENKTFFLLLWNSWKRVFRVQRNMSANTFYIYFYFPSDTQNHTGSE